MYEKHKLSVELINDYEQIVFHQNVNKVQRACYKNHHKSISILNNKLLIEIDYKQRIRLGMSPRQVGQEYYNQETRSCLGWSIPFNALFFFFNNFQFKGFGIYFVENNEIKEINFNIISANLEQGAAVAVLGFRVLRNQDFFKKIDTHDYIVWTDCGPTFRNQVFLGYLLLELKEKKIRGIF
jgi:hypothetical protein